MRHSIQKVIFVAFAIAASLSQAVAQDKNDHANTVVLVGSTTVDGTTDQYMVNMNDGSVFHNRGEEEAQFIGKFDSEELNAIKQDLGALKYKELSITHKDGKAYQYVMIMGNGEEYSLSWNDKTTEEVQHFYNRIHSRCGLLRSDYSIAY